MIGKFITTFCGVADNEEGCLKLWQDVDQLEQCVVIQFGSMYAIYSVGA